MGNVENFAAFLLAMSAQFTTTSLGAGLYPYPKDAGRVALHHYMGNRVAVWDAGPCEGNPGCVCTSNLEGRSLHCEGEFHAQVDRGSISVFCNKSISGDRVVSHDFFTLLNLDKLLIADFILFECPEPVHSYHSLLFSTRPTAALTTGTQGRFHDVIPKLQIDCGSRGKFSLHRRFLVGLKETRYLQVKCLRIFELPEDLFVGTTPSLKRVEISKTQLQHIPTKFFSSLNKLERIFLNENHVKVLQNDILSGVNTLLQLELRQNGMTLIEDGVFNPVQNLQILYLDNNMLRTLPSSLGNLTKLKILNLSFNNLEAIHEKDFIKLVNLEELYLENNPIRFLDLKALSLASILFIKISKKYLKSDEDESKPLTIGWSDNVDANMKVESMMTSGTLEELELSNTSILELPVETFHGLPRLKLLVLSSNKISYLYKDTFVRNVELKNICLEGNSLSKLPSEVFHGNSQLKIIHLSSNELNSIPVSVFSKNQELTELDLSRNFLTSLPSRMLAHNRELNVLNLSYNKLSSLEIGFFDGTPNLRVLLMSGNNMTQLPDEIFFPFSTNVSQLHGIFLDGNSLSVLPQLQLPQLEELNLGDNKLTNFSEDSFRGMPNIISINLSGNQLYILRNSPMVTISQGLRRLDLSLNRFKMVPFELLKDALFLTHLNLSGNLLQSFYINSIMNCRNLLNLDLSNNGMSLFMYFGTVGSTYFSGRVIGSEFQTSLKVLNLTNNQLDFNYSQGRYDRFRKTWGKISPLVYFLKLEEIILFNNTIDQIFLDWRQEFRYLRYLDLRKNKLKYLTYEEQMFSSVIIEESDERPYPCNHSLTVDLRENLIEGVEIPFPMLRNVTSKNELDGLNSHVSILLENNPIVCGCEVINFLRLLAREAVLTSEKSRVDGLDWILPAKLIAGDLRCWEPLYIRGKSLNEPETWMHHILPFIGVCLKP